MQPKVVVQRNGQEMLQSTNMAQIVDHQNQQTIQYHFAPQIDQSQGQQIIIQQQPTQQIKQTIYPQQPNQVSHWVSLREFIYLYLPIAGADTVALFPASAERHPARGSEACDAE